MYLSKPGFTFRLLTAALVVLAVVAASAPQARAASCPAAGAVNNAAAAFTNAARSGSASAFSSALARHTDVRGAALSALGPYRKQLPAGRQREYVNGAQAFMARFLMKNSRPFRSSRDLQIESCRANLVETSLAGKSRMIWRVSGGRIRDVQVSGVWLALQLRSKFTGIIRRNNGRIDALLDYLRRSGD
ncbi:MAG: ABC transporter substrate-binding protein [Parvibaculaceae bacterium]